ncbi:lysostaphin resistance A-like protein [Butyricicoccus pullicaecorum]|uniref:CPBP family intramembrane glutamic endopeptidase n=1 Tax=Butyricicoccus pullicaecorum TaxID=501571 RepID=UPI003521A4A8
MNKIPCALPRVDWRPSLIQEKSDSRSFTAVWLCLFLFSGLFALLQAFILPPLHLPQGVMFMLCSCLAASPILCYGSRIGVWRLYPVTGTQRPPVRVLLYLFSIILILNLLISLCTPAIEHALRLVGIGLREVTINTASSLSLTLYVCIVAPIVEELIYRGVILRKLLPYGTHLAIVLPAVCFALMHHNFYQGLSAVLGGLVYGFVALRYSLAASICLHIAKNTVSTVLPLLEKGGELGAWTTLLLFFIAGVFVLIGSIIVIRRKSFQLPQSVSFSNQPRAILAHPALWLVLLFDTVMLIVLNFTHV